MDQYLRSKSNLIKQVTASISTEKKNIEIIKTGGITLSDNQPLTSFKISLIMKKDLKILKARTQLVEE